jgi:tellurite resistance protein TehA-like permease
LLNGEADTNIITWGLWALESLLSFGIYKRQSGNDFATYLEELVASFGCITITLLLTGRALIVGADIVGPLAWVDGISAILFVIVFLIYQQSIKSGNVWPATLSFQGVLIFSSLPLVRSTLENPSGEPFLPWVLWSTGFALQFACAYLRGKGEHSARALLTPGNYFFWHGAMAVIIINAA